MVLLQAAHVLHQHRIAAGQQAGEDMLFLGGMVRAGAAVEEAADLVGRGARGVVDALRRRAGRTHCCSRSSVRITSRCVASSISKVGQWRNGRARGALAAGTGGAWWWTWQLLWTGIDSSWVQALRFVLDQRRSANPIVLRGARVRCESLATIRIATTYPREHIMRIALVVAGLALAASAQAAPPEHYRLQTAAELARVCATSSSESDHVTAVAFCHGVLAGAYGYFLSATPAADRFVCPPNPTPTRSAGRQRFRRLAEGAAAVQQRWRHRRAVPLRGRSLSLQALSRRH